MSDLTFMDEIPSDMSTAIMNFIDKVYHGDHEREIKREFTYNDDETRIWSYRVTTGDKYRGAKACMNAREIPGDAQEMSQTLAEAITTAQKRGDRYAYMELRRRRPKESGGGNDTPEWEPYEYGEESAQPLALTGRTRGGKPVEASGVLAIEMMKGMQMFRGFCHDVMEQNKKMMESNVQLATAISYHQGASEAAEENADKEMMLEAMKIFGPLLSQLAAIWAAGKLKPKAKPGVEGLPPEKDSGPPNEMTPEQADVLAEKTIETFEWLCAHAPQTITDARFARAAAAYQSRAAVDV